MLIIIKYSAYIMFCAENLVNPRFFSFIIQIEGTYIEFDYSKLEGKYKIKAIYQKQYSWSYDYLLGISTYTSYGLHRI